MKLLLILTLIFNLRLFADDLIQKQLDDWYLRLPEVGKVGIHFRLAIKEYDQGNWGKAEGHRRTVKKEVEQKHPKNLAYKKAHLFLEHENGKFGYLDPHTTIKAVESIY